MAVGGKTSQAQGTDPDRQECEEGRLGTGKETAQQGPMEVAWRKTEGCEGSSQNSSSQISVFKAPEDFRLPWRTRELLRHALQGIFILI